MKIEKVNDHQIRCTLTKADLADRHLKLSELAYGTEKAKSLFRDMMQQAAYQFGFEAEDIPLMIEAIPISGDSIVLIITKVEDPEELDTRFSKFAPDPDDDNYDNLPSANTSNVTANDVINLFKKIHDDVLNTIADKSAPANNEQPVIVADDEDLCRLYAFDELDDVIRLAHTISGFYHGENRLYKDVDGTFILSMHKTKHTKQPEHCHHLSMQKHRLVLQLHSAR